MVGGGGKSRAEERYARDLGTKWTDGGEREACRSSSSVSTSVLTGLCKMRILWGNYNTIPPEILVLTSNTVF